MINYQEMLPCEGYSVLMSVYAGSDPGQLEAALNSMLRQTLPTDDLVLVCDGPLTPALDAVIETTFAAFPRILQVLRLPRHAGLVTALNTGLARCRHELVARMDSDDISLPHRCQQQVSFLTGHPELAIVSSTVLEFTASPAHITGQRALPLEHEALCRFSRKRSPFNHPAVMYRKSAVAAVGGYRGDYPLFEDYDLWVRMLRVGFRGENLREPLLFMRSGPGMYRRRGGSRYALNLLRFHGRLCREGWSSPTDFLTGALPHALACLLPTVMLGLVYRWLHRKGECYGLPNPDRGHGALQPSRHLPGF